jgi:tetratricopeptide (TPR) repeat protein
VTRPDQNPYPGLRSFEDDEIDVFFGRDECIDGMLDRLRDTHFLAVLGSSGTGKSSLVKTGLIAALRMGLIAEAGSRWRVVTVKPGGAPLRNLARGLIEAESTPKDAADAVEALRGRLAGRGAPAVIDWCQRELGDGESLLLVVDQFEELFRFGGYAAQQEAEAFAGVLIECAEVRDRGIYPTITMRSEYLGHCSLIEGLAEAISVGMFLVPRMTRDQCRQAIEGPARVRGGAVAEPLVDTLLGDLTRLAPWDEGANVGEADQLDRLARRADQLPLLQFALNRMWLAAPKKPDGSALLTLDDYRNVGGLEGALDAQGNRILQGLGKPQQAVAETLFRALTEGTTVADAKRRPQRFEELTALCGGEEAENALRTVIDAFREPGCAFVTLDPGPEINDGALVDVTHESVIRQWKRLSDWVKAEGEAGREWRRLKDETDRFKEHRGDLLSRQELQTVDSWWTRTKPNEPWAKRYGDDHKAVEAFYDHSLRAHRRRALFKWFGVAAAAFLGVVSVGALGWGVSKVQQAERLEALETKDRGYRSAAKDYAQRIDPMLQNLGEERRRLDTTSRERRDEKRSKQDMANMAEFVDKQVPKLIEAQIAVLEQMRKVDPDDADFSRAELGSLTVAMRWTPGEMSPERRAAIKRHSRLAVGIARDVWPTIHGEMDLFAVLDAFDSSAETLDQNDDDRPDGLALIGAFLDGVSRLDPLRVAMEPRQISAQDFLLYLKIKGLWRKASLLAHLGRAEDSESVLRDDIHAVETWRRDTGKTCIDVAADLHNDLAQVLLVENWGEANPSARKIRGDEVIEEYRRALNCDSEEFRANDSIENGRWVATRATRLANAEENAGNFKQAERDYRLAVEFRRKMAQRGANSENADEDKRALASSLRSLGYWQTEYGDVSEGVNSSKECVSIIQELIRKNPTLLNYAALGYCYRALGFSLRRSSKLADAEQAYRNAIDNFRNAGEKDQEDLAWLGLAATQILGRKAGADVRKLEAREYDNDLRQLQSERDAYKMKHTYDNAASLAGALAEACFDAVINGKTAEAARYADEAARLHIDLSPANRVNLAHAYLVGGRVAEAEKLYSSSRDQIRDIREDFEVFTNFGVAVPAMDQIRKDVGI